MREYTEALRLAKREAEERFPEGEYTLKVLLWCDDDFRISVRHGFGQTGDEEVGNSLAEEIVVTPHRAELQVIETTRSERTNIHKREDL